MSILSSSTELFYPDKAIVSATSAIDTLSNTVSIMGVDFQDMVSQLTKLQSAFAALGDRMTSAESTLNHFYEAIEQNRKSLDCIRSVTDALTENPNQKDDSEILNAIVPTEEFVIKYSNIVWDDDGNMFLN